jgi:hypothetical protein
LATVAKAKEVDLEAWEFFLRRAVLTAGARVMEDVLAEIGCGRRAEPVLCTCGERMGSVGVRAKTIRTILGPVPFQRSLFICPACGKARIPGDELLDIEETGFSPGARRLMVHAGSRTSFIEAEEDLQLYANLDADRRDIERVAEGVGESIEAWMKQRDAEALNQARHISVEPADKTIPALYVAFDGTGIPMRREELEGRKGKGSDEKPKTREVKLGCAFTQTTCDEKGRPVRDPDSTTYVGAIENSECFGWRIYAEALRRGLDHAENVVVLTDGARYNKTIAQMHFPNAIHIIDLYHAREHVCEIAKLLLPEATLRRRESEWLALLDAGKIENLIKRMIPHIPRRGEKRKEALRGTEYLRENANRMRYADFKSQGFFVGSGVIEAGCRTVIAQRLKKSGMFWSVAGANAIIAARCCIRSRRFNDFWEERAAG